ncbi:MAG: hypothetical protein J6I55_03395 [Ruminococcus sp.]|nr:hypothetical protein [Ruminococcus sp.]
MKYPQQLDAHIKSYKRERIRKLLQTFREQKELLTLSEEPVKKIHYKISFPETSAIIALLPKKPDILKFPPVEYKKTKKVTPPTFKELNYKHLSPDINPEKITANINPKIFPDDVKIPVPYYKKTEIKKVTPPVFGSQIYSNKVPDVSIKTATANINPKIFPDDIKIPVPYYKKTEIKTTPLTFKELNYKHQSPDIIPEKITANINFHKNKPVQFKPTNQNITLPVLKTSTINFGKINFKNNFNTAELKPMPEVSKTTYQNIKIDTNFCNGIKLNDIPKASLPKFRNTDINIPPVKKKNFRLPDLDFSDTLEKLKNAIIKDMGKYNEE